MFEKDGMSNDDNKIDLGEIAGRPLLPFTKGDVQQGEGLRRQERSGGFGKKIWERGARCAADVVRHICNVLCREQHAGIRC